MRWFRNLKTSVKILGLIMLMIFFLAIVGYAGHYAAGNLAASMDDMYQNRLLSIQWLNAARTESRINEALTLAVFLNQDKAKQQALLKEIEDHKGSFAKLLDDYAQTKLDSFETKRLSTVRDEVKIYRGEWQKALDIAVDSRQMEGYAYFIQNAASHLDTINKLLNELADDNAKMAAAEKAKSDALVVFNDRIIMGVTLLAVVLALGLGWFISRLIAGPLAQLVAEVRQLAAGNLAVRHSNTNYTDEVGQLTREIDMMAGNLRSLVTNITQTAAQLTASSEELTASADQAAQATGQVTTAIAEVAQGAQEQSHAIDETTNIVLQMSTAIEQIAANANTVTGAVAKTVTAATEGAQSAKAVSSQMDNIEQTVASSAQAVTKLGDRSKEIGQIVDTISGIAGQTNLLALNAAIEAARAGEQGRGFAVVAEEVRKLAEQSQEAAGRIAAMIGDVQAETDKAVASMNEGSREVKMGAEVVASAGRSFQEIVSLVNEVSSQIMEISAAIQQMSAGSQQIVSAVRNIDQVGKKSAGRTQTVSAATEEHSASVEEIAASSQALASMAEKLQAAVTKFQV
jgi:methyl-accepting chemotaxis protein